METFRLIVKIIMIVGAVYFTVCALIYNQLAWRWTIPVPKFILKLIAGNVGESQFDKDMAAAKENLKNYPIEREHLITCREGDLVAYTLIPEKSNGRVIIACHGARSTGLGEFAYMVPYFYEKDYTVIMPDHRGCGESKGDFMGYGTQESEDMITWILHAMSKFQEMDIFLLGVSMGAATVLMTSDKMVGQLSEGIVADCSYTSAWDEFAYQLKTSFHLPPFPLLHGCDLISRVAANYSFKDASPLKCVKNSRVPILFIHGDKDDFVPFYMRDILYDACASEKYKYTCEGAVHARSYYTNPKAYQEAIEEFFDKCIEKREKKE